jgi:hypothetical protein
MDGRSRRAIEMGTRALEFSRAHPDTDAGYAVSAAKLEQLMARAREIAAAQREGLIDNSAASARKATLRRAILSGPIRHLAEVAQVAAKEDHELTVTFRFKPGADTYLAFRTAARGMLAAAQEHESVLAKYGRSESVLEQFGQMLDQFDAAVMLGNDGRTAHKGATVELRTVATMIRQTVRVMDARNRQRFDEDGQLLGSWLSASKVLGSPRAVSAPATTVPDVGTPADGEARPAA